MGTWNWTYLFAAGEQQINFLASLETLLTSGWVESVSEQAATPTRLEGGDWDFFNVVGLGDNPKARLIEMLDRDETVQVRLLGKDLFLTVNLVSGSADAGVRSHLALGWLARSIDGLEPPQQDSFFGFLRDVMESAGASLALAVSEPPDNFGDRLVSIDGIEVFENSDWRGSPYEILFVWLNPKLGGVQLPHGLEHLGPEPVAEYTNGIVEFRRVDSNQIKPDIEAVLLQTDAADPPTDAR